MRVDQLPHTPLLQIDEQEGVGLAHAAEALIGRHDLIIRNARVVRDTVE